MMNLWVTLIIAAGTFGFGLLIGYLKGWYAGSDSGWQSAIRETAKHPERWLTKTFDQADAEALKFPSVQRLPCGCMPETWRLNMEALARKGQPERGYHEFGCP